MVSYPKINYNLRGTRYQIDFLVDQRKCDLFSLLSLALDTFERVKEKHNFKIKDIQSFKEGNIMTIQVQFEESVGNPKNKITDQGTLYISGEMISERPNFKFILEKSDKFSDLDLQAFYNVYEEAIKPQDNFYKQYSQISSSSQQKSSQKHPFQESDEQAEKDKQTQEAYKKLEEFGVTVFVPQEENTNLTWDYLAGYETQKRDIEDTVLLGLSHPEIYDKITQGTRMKQEPNRPKAVLFEGPPGTGKTTSAKIIAQQVDIPLVYIPIESIMSKYYGESEKKFADIWDACKQIGKTIIFIDEIDALASARNDNMHEGSKRVLSTLLRKIDSFESSTDVLLIAATNRKSDLDTAMLSRIDLSIEFQLPDFQSRIEIYKRYAKHLSTQEFQKLANISQYMSGRNIADICKDAERRWASKIIRKETDQDLPSLQQYIDTIESRKKQNLA